MAILKNKKAQLDYPIITLIILFAGLILVGIIIMKIFVSIQSPLSNAFGNVTGGEIAQTNFNSIMNTATTFWDKVIVTCFIFGVILMFISAFYIDAHPIFVTLYLFISIFTMVFAPTIIDSLKTLYDSSSFTTESALMPMTYWLIQYFGEVLVGLLIVTGVIIYGKIAWSSNR